MKYHLLIILEILLLFAVPIFAQEIDKIILASQKADEPPTKQGQPEYTIEFKKDEKGDFISAYYYIGEKRNSLQEKILIKQNQTNKVNEWRMTNKKKFLLSELDLDSGMLEAAKRRSPYKLYFAIPRHIIINADSFKFCQDYKMTRELSTGGSELKITLIDKTGNHNEYHFGSNDIGERRFDLQNYIFCYTILRGKIPNKFPYFELFTQDRFIDIILYYQQTVECEGFFYKEFINKKPGRTSKDNRLRTGWNFYEYMKYRVKDSIK
jgi:hypothetical protein